MNIAEADTAAKIQMAVDELAKAGGGRLVLPEMEITIDRGIALRSNIELVGQGEGTVLRKGPARIYPLSGYHNYGMCDVPLLSTEGLEAGMTVSIADNRTRGGFAETFAIITWIEDNWVGIDRGLECDYAAAENPSLVTVYPLIFGHGIRNAALRNITLEGNRGENAKAMGSCRGGAVYFCHSRDIELSGIHQRNYNGDGLSLQMSRNVRVLNCSFDENTGNGLHPGSGGTNMLFENCTATGNTGCGFFFCVRANHITVKNCVLADNGLGVSIGTRDCHNILESCSITGNQGAGIRIRPSPYPTEVHSCLVRDCDVIGNALSEGQGQIEILNDAHDLIFEHNRVASDPRKLRAGFFIEAGAKSVSLQDNHFTACSPEVATEQSVVTHGILRIECGYQSASEKAFRHLGEEVSNENTKLVENQCQ